LDETLEALKDAPGIVAAATQPTFAATTVDAWNADAAILAMVGGERGLMDALDTLDRLRGRVAGVLAARDPAAVERRMLGSMERTLRELLLYVEQVTNTGGDAADIPFPTVPELTEVTADAPLGPLVQSLVDETRSLHASLKEATP
ncbi:MAG: hypothetical protein ACOCYE_06310, partial [Pseudomonadota bacterium]